MTTITDLSTEELEALLVERKKSQKAQAEAARKAWEKGSDNTIDSLFDEAEELALLTSRFKQKCHVIMEQKKIELDEYGGIRSNSKGGFSIVHSNCQRQVTRRRDTDPIWDARAGKAVDLIKAFLSDTVKKRDAKLHDILMGFIERNAQGDLEYAKVMELLRHEDKFADNRWVSGLKLIKESYSLSFKAFAYEFKKKDASGKWKSLSLNFSSL